MAQSSADVLDRIMNGHGRVVKESLFQKLRLMTADTFPEQCSTGFVLAVAFAFQENPDLTDFKQWVNSTTMMRPGDDNEAVDRGPFFPSTSFVGRDDLDWQLLALTLHRWLTADQELMPQSAALIEFMKQLLDLSDDQRVANFKETLTTVIPDGYEDGRVYIRV